MHPEFANAVESLHPSFERLVSMPPVANGQFPGAMPSSGIYLFSEAGRHLYVGRSRNMRRRSGLHTRLSAQHNQASFAFLLAREALNYPKASYKAGELSRSGLFQNPEFFDAFTKAKARIKSMDYRFVEEADPTRQALLEMYCAVALSTPYNDFDTH
jgi:hypothetical protein